jgi:hypothetical protein
MGGVIPGMGVLNRARIARQALAVGFLGGFCEVWVGFWEKGFQARLRASGNAHKMGV